MEERRMARLTKEEKQIAYNNLKEYVKEGDTIYTIVKKVAPSGMSRQMAVIVRTDTGISNISWWVARALGYRMCKGRDCFSISGCGQDMGFAVAYDIGAELFGDGYKVKHSWL
jgi:thiamine pyrophosphate-dependent acetolactate synthase large subunit-like protein